MKPLLGILYGEWTRIRALCAVAVLLLLCGFALESESRNWEYSDARAIYLPLVWLFTLFFLFHLGFPRDRKGHFRSTPSLLERTLPMGTFSHALALWTIRTLAGFACAFGLMSLADPFVLLPAQIPLLVWFAVAVACQQLIAIAPLLPGSILFLAFWISSTALSAIPDYLVAIYSLLAITTAVSLFAKFSEHIPSVRHKWFTRWTHPASQKIAAPRSTRVAMLLQQCPPPLVGGVVALSFSLAIFNLLSFHYTELLFPSIFLMPSCGLILGLLWERDATRTTYPSPGLPVDIAEAGFLRATAGMLLCTVAALAHIFPYALMDLLVYDARTLLYEEGVLDRQHWRGLSHDGSVRPWIAQSIQVVFATWFAFSIGRFALALSPTLLFVYYVPTAVLYLLAWCTSSLLVFALLSDFYFLFNSYNVVYGISLCVCAVAPLLIWAVSPTHGPLHPQRLKRARYGLYFSTSALAMCIIAILRTPDHLLSLFPVTGVATVFAWHAWSIRLIPFRTLALLGLASIAVALLSAAVVLPLSLDATPRRMLLYTAYFAGSIVAGSIWQVLWLDYQRRG